MTRPGSWDSTRICRLVRDVIIRKPNSSCRFFVSLTGLEWTEVVSVGGYVACSFNFIDGSTIRDQIVPVGQHERMSPYIGKANMSPCTFNHCMRWMTAVRLYPGRFTSVVLTAWAPQLVCHNLWSCKESSQIPVLCVCPSHYAN
jgi:hypothetical protein